MNKIQVLLSALLLTLTIGCSSAKKTETVKTADTVTVQSLIVEPAPFTEYGSYYGRISPIKEARIICYSGGRVEKINSREGDFVKEGSSLASIDAEKAISLLETTKLQEKIAQQNLDQSKRHLEQGNLSQLAVDQANLALLSAQSARIDAQKNYRGALAITPLTGTVISRFIDIYQEIPPGTPLYTVAQTATMKISISIAESDAVYVKEGNDVELEVATVPGKIWKGAIRYISKEASDEKKAFEAEIYVDNKDGELKPGTTGKVLLALRIYTDKVSVPSEAIRNEGVRASLLVIDSSSIARRRLIETGPQTGNSTLILSGVDPGERVIVAGQHLVTDGSPVHYK